MSDDTLRAFVIMAFDPEFEAIFGDLIRPSLEAAGYEVTRADSLMNQQNILKDIIREIARADLVIAELTALNPNVFYELGIAHALRKRTVLLTQSVEELPFDLRSYRVIAYSTRFDEVNKLSDTLTTIAQKAKTQAIDFGNPVIDFLPDGTSHTPTIDTSLPTKKPTEPVVAEPEEEKGLWDFVVEGEEAMQKSQEIITRLAQATQEVGERMTARTVEVGRIQKSGVPGSAAKMYRLVELTASEISAFAEKVEAELPGLHSTWEIFSESASGMLRTTKIRTGEDKAAAQQFKEQLVILANTIAESLVSTKGFRDAQAQLRGISKSMNRTSRKTTSALDKVISEFEQSIAYCTKVIGLLDETNVARHSCHLSRLCSSAGWYNI